MNSSEASDRPAWEIPIIDAGGRIVGWTARSLKLMGPSIQHEEAERLTGTPVAAVYVLIHTSTDAKRAGAPPGWQGPWRCLALCSQALLGADGTWAGVDQMIGALAPQDDD